MTREHIMTRSSVTAEAIQFEGTEKSFGEIFLWVAEYNGSIVVTWNGDEGNEKFEAYPGYLEIADPGRKLQPMECPAGDWVVKSSRDTFYTVDNDTFHEIWAVMH